MSVQELSMAGVYGDRYAHGTQNENIFNVLTKYRKFQTSWPEHY